MAAVRIFYCGVPLGAEILRRTGAEIVALALGPLDLAGRSRLRRRLPRALVLGLPDLADPATAQAIASTSPNVLISFFWPKRIPGSWLRRLPAYGTHPSLLPRWRGPDPYFWALREGELTTGVTLHALEDDYDTGDVVASRAIAIEPEDDAMRLARRLDRPALALLVELVDTLRRGETPTAVPQVGAATWARQPEEEDLVIEWARPAQELANLIRAASPEPGATALLGGVEVEIVRACVETRSAPAGLRHAEAWRSADGWSVRCGEGALRLLSVRGADGEPVDLDAVFQRG